MAESELDLAPEGVDAPKSKTKLLLIVAGVVLALVAGAGGLYVSGIFSSPEAGAAQAKPKEELKKQAIYVGLDPSFTVNLASGGKARYLQAGVEVLTRDPAVQGHVKQHMPVIRNGLVLLFSGKSYEDLVSLEGKEALRAEALASVQRVLQAETGSPGIEDLFFTSFVMQ